MRIFALSDVHVDYAENMTWLEGLDRQIYRGDALILPGDASHVDDRLREMFSILKARFAEVFFVPGNHELWTTKQELGHALDKFERVLDLCRRAGVHTAPKRLENGGGEAVWVVPLFSWYTRPEEGGDSLYVDKPGEDPDLRMWSDNYFVRWPDSLNGLTPNAYFLRRNQHAVTRSYDAPVVSYSHFLPRQELIFSFPRDQKHKEKRLDPNPSFNFSRVAGSSDIDAQIRAIGSRVHVYGHQHRNRCRDIDGVTYVSHCLGYGHERKKGHVRFIENGPKHIWTIGKGKPASLAECY